jgi:hypothetical protein
MEHEYECMMLRLYIGRLHASMTWARAVLEGQLANQEGRANAYDDATLNAVIESLGEANPLTSSAMIPGSPRPARKCKDVSISPLDWALMWAR